MNDVDRHSRIATGNPLGYLPAEAIPGICQVLSEGAWVRLRVIGCLKPLAEGEPLALEIREAELLEK